MINKLHDEFITMKLNTERLKSLTMANEDKKMDRNELIKLLQFIYDNKLSTLEKKEYEVYFIEISRIIIEGG